MINTQYDMNLSKTHINSTHYLFLKQLFFIKISETINLLLKINLIR